MTLNIKFYFIKNINEQFENYIAMNNSENCAIVKSGSDCEKKPKYEKNT